jgi:UDP-GlcNAc:undecaprenyl-phosphate GlcNAc-1-phosphate transferase
MDWLLIVILLSTSRVSFRLLGETLRPESGHYQRVLIYGAGDGGELMLRELRHNPALRREAVGFLDDDRSKAGSRIHEVPVLAGLDQIAAVLAEHRVGEVIVSSVKIPRERIERLESICAAQGVAVVRASIRLE